MQIVKFYLELDVLNILHLKIRLLNAMAFKMNAFVKGRRHSDFCLIMTYKAMSPGDVPVISVSLIKVEVFMPRILRLCSGHELPRINQSGHQFPIIGYQINNMSFIVRSKPLSTD